MKIILFDGVCNLCNNSVNFIIKRDTKKMYAFESLQSKKGQAYLKKFDLALDDFDTLVLIDEDKFYIESTAVLMISKDLSGFVRFLYPLIYIPKSIRDIFYRLIAKNRFN
ncbi:MAG: DUF393 domain-containing protein [Sulfurimonas sp.]|nr:DUF393 domain-containing protein [Sulfurimonas sp.]MDQ7059706.1 DUF393 domain-containing protein [Sulfurimonas sp.]